MTVLPPPAQRHIQHPARRGSGPGRV